MNVMKNIKINLCGIIHYCIIIGGAIFSLLGFVSVFINIEGCFSNWLDATLCILLVLIAVVIISCIFTLAIREKVIFVNKNQKTLSVGYGDLFTEKAKIKVIAVNRCFDTIVNDLISPKSLHGKLIQDHLSNMSVEELNGKITESLRRQGCKGEEILYKSKGNKIRYPVGTIAELNYGNTCYYLLALTEMDVNLNTYCTLEDYCLAISKLMYYYDKNGQGYEMVLPIMGSGFTRLDRSEKQLLELISSLIKIHYTQMRGNIKIVIYKDLRNVISIANLQKDTEK